jgi:hypothetical protein
MTLLEHLTTTDAPVVTELISTPQHTPHEILDGAWNNQATWDNWAKSPAPFDNRPTWDNWNKKK